MSAIGIAQPGESTEGPAPAVDEMRSRPRPLVLVTGLSGAGLSTTLKALEDSGYEAVDNLRLSLVPALIEHSDAVGRPLAIEIDSRTRDFDPFTLLNKLDALAARKDLHVRLLFLECADEVLQRRYTETRRRHPLADDRPVADGIARERALLAPLRDRADITLDTTALSIHDLKRLAAGHFGLEVSDALRIFVMSFSFRQGLPREADLVFDVRFLVNPHWDLNLRPFDGTDPAVAAAVAADPDFTPFLRNLTGLLRPLFPRYKQEGKTYLTIAIGCTGGRHRSVFVAEQLARWVREEGLTVGLRHRDLDRGAARLGEG